MSWVVYGAYGACSQSDHRKIAQFRLSTNQIAGFAHLHIQDGISGAIFALDQSEGRKTDHVHCHMQITWLGMPK